MLEFLKLNSANFAHLNPRKKDSMTSAAVARPRCRYRYAVFRAHSEDFLRTLDVSGKCRGQRWGSIAGKKKDLNETFNEIVH